MGIENPFSNANEPSWEELRRRGGERKQRGARDIVPTKEAPLPRRKKEEVGDETEEHVLPPGKRGEEESGVESSGVLSIEEDKTPVSWKDFGEEEAPVELDEPEVWAETEGEGAVTEEEMAEEHRQEIEAARKRLEIEKDFAPFEYAGPADTVDEKTKVDPIVIKQNEETGEDISIQETKQRRRAAGSV